MTLGEALKKGIEILRNCAIDAPAVDAGVILCHVLNKDRTWIFAHDNDILDTEQEQIYFNLIYQRSLKKPLQYITQLQEFMSLEFYVNENVLIPRADTEILVEDIIEYVRDSNDTLEILDIGTGSGCIAVSLAYYIKGCRVTAADISPNALEVAEKNALKHGVRSRMDFIQGDITQGIVFSKKNAPMFDIVVSNPPYIKSSDIPQLQVEVGKYEPITALDGGKDGLDFYRIIVNHARRYLKPGGMLAFEVGCGQFRMVEEMMQSGFEDIRIINDYAGIERVVAGIRKFY